MLESIVRQSVSAPTTGEGAQSHRFRSWPLILILLLAFFFRVHHLAVLPATLYHDEAFNVLDAMRILQGEHPIFFPANSGREPLFIYVVALFLALFGRSIFALHLASVFVGILTIPASYLLTRQLFGRAVALLATFWLATSFWHIDFSRISYRAISLQLLEALCFYFLWRGLHSRRYTDFAWSGLFLGGASYTYISSRFLPVMLLIFFVLGSAFYPSRLRGLKKHLLLLAGVAGLVFAPLGSYFLRHPVDFIQRTSTVSLLDPVNNHGDLAGALIANFWSVLAMFSVHGDENWRHNIAGLPIFSWPLAALFYGALLLCLWRLWRQQGLQYLFILIWLFVMLFPSVLAIEAPNFLRLLSLTPVVFILPALSVEALHKWLGRLGQRPHPNEGRSASFWQGWLLKPGEDVSLATLPRFLSGLALVILLAWSAGDTYFRYFVIWADNPHVYDAFDGPPRPQHYTHSFLVPPLVHHTSLEFGNSLTLLGYTLSSDQVTPGQQLQVQLVWQAERSPASKYVVFVHLLDHTDKMLAQQDNEPQEGSRPTTSLFPGEVLADTYRLVVPANATPGLHRIEVGLYDRDSGEHLPVRSPSTAQPGQSAIVAPVLVRAASPPDLSSLQAKSDTFAYGIRFRGYRATLYPAAASGQQRLDVLLGWQASGPIPKDYTVFVHILDPVGRLVAQNDSLPAQGGYPTSAWQEGDTILDLHRLLLPAGFPDNTYQLEIGLYDAATLQRLPLQPKPGQAPDTRVLIRSVVSVAPASPWTATILLGALPVILVLLVLLYLKRSRHR